MAGSCSTGQSLGPVFLRLALGVTFLWAGFGKVLEMMPVQGQAAATLANMGVLQPSAAPAPESPTPAKPPKPGDVTAPPEKPAPPPTGQTAPKPLMQTSQEKAPAKSGETPAPDAARPAPPAKVFTASDFPTEVRVRAVYGIALLLHSAANPAAASDGTTPMPLVPARLAEDRWPVYLAWSAAGAELLGGLFVLVGLFTRLSALALAGTMATAIWLTQIGPAVQAHNTLLGFLPNHPAHASDAAGNPVHAILLWQFLLLCACLSVVFTGAGAMSFDRALLPPLGRREAPPKD